MLVIEIRSNEQNEDTTVDFIEIWAKWFPYFSS